MKRTARALPALLFAALLGAPPPAVSAEGTLPEDVARPAIERRAADAAIWGMPAVNYDLMLQEMLSKTEAKPNQVLYWGRPLDWHNQTLTPNPDSIYLMAFYNTKEAGPVVIEVPPVEGGSINGNIVDLWQMPLEDTGPSGADKGKGGKYLILPAGYAGAVPQGYIPLRSNTYGGYALLRSNLKSHGDEDVAKSVAYGKRVKVYPLSQAASPPPTTFADAKDVVFDSTIRYDASFFEHLDRIVQAEPWLDRDRAMIDTLKGLGIEKGKPFAPDAATRQALDAGIGAARKELAARYDAGFPPFWDGSRWMFPAPPELVKAAQSSFNDANAYPVDARGLAYTYAFIGFKRLGSGQFYLISIKDKDGQPFDGGKSYRLTVPPNVPVEQYWSVTAYDRITHALIRNMPRASRASNAAEVQKNPDGSVDVYFGPEAPTGQETNWVPTDPERQFEVMFRLYAPTKALFEKTWRLPDVERVGAGTSAQAEPAASPKGAAIPVTADNFVRAESDMYFGGVAKDYGFGKLGHNREPAPIDNQTVIRLNRDTLYSAGVFDLDAGPVTITLPDAGKRFMSMQVIDEDEYTHGVFYGAGSHTLTRKNIGTRYVATAFRTLVDPTDPKDLDEVRALQDAIKVEQPGGPGTFELPNWDPVSQKKVREALLALAASLPDSKGMFGPKDAVDEVRHLIGAASAWGGNPEKEATYLNVTPARNDGKTIYRLSVKDVPVDGFWSISVYNAEGYFQKNPYNAYTLNDITAQKSADGSVQVQFGGCDGKIANCLPTVPGWNYLVRLYRPRAEILNGTWKFPEAEPVEGVSRALE